MFGGASLAAIQDSILVQDYLTSRGAMLTLDADHGYREHFSKQNIDALQRIGSESSNEALYKHYKTNVRVGFDPTEGIIRMEVSAMAPNVSRVFSKALIGYAENHIDQITERKRTVQVDRAKETFFEAEARMIEAQDRVLELQTQLGIVDPDAETASVMEQVNSLNLQLAEKNLHLSQLLDNKRPNEARVAGIRGDIIRLEEIIANLRLQFTNKSGEQHSLASIAAQLRMAESDLALRSAMMQEALRSLELARITADRQVRFISVGVEPIAPDEASYPKAFENTLIAFVLFVAAYLMAAVTAAILREQASC